jgi:hypothetical protein
MIQAQIPLIPGRRFHRRTSCVPPSVQNRRQVRRRLYTIDDASPILVGAAGRMSPLLSKDMTAPGVSANPVNQMSTSPSNTAMSGARAANAAYKTYFATLPQSQMVPQGAADIIPRQARSGEVTRIFLSIFRERVADQQSLAPPVSEYTARDRHARTMQLQPIPVGEGATRQPPRTNLTPTGPLANLTLRSLTPPAPLIQSPRPQRPLPRRAGADPLPHGAPHEDSESGDESDMSPRPWSPIDRGERSASPGRARAAAGYAGGGSDKEEGPSRKKEKGRVRKAAIACNRCRSKLGIRLSRLSLPVYITNVFIERKIACDGIKPHPCSSCLGKTWECVYVDKQRRRGPGKAPRGTRRVSRRAITDARPTSSRSSSDDPPRSPSDSRSFPAAGRQNAPAAGPSHAAAADVTAAPGTSPLGVLRGPERDYLFIAEQPGLAAGRRATRRRMEPTGAGVAEPRPGRAGGSTLYLSAHGAVPPSVPPHQIAMDGTPAPARAPTGEFTFSLASTTGRDGSLLRRSAPIYADVSRVDGGGGGGGGGGGRGGRGRAGTPPGHGADATRPNRGRGGTPSGGTRPPQRDEDGEGQGRPRAVSS